MYFPGEGEGFGGDATLRGGVGLKVGREGIASITAAAAKKNVEHCFCFSLFFFVKANILSSSNFFQLAKSSNKIM